MKVFETGKKRVELPRRTSACRLRPSRSPLQSPGAAPGPPPAAASSCEHRPGRAGQSWAERLGPRRAAGTRRRRGREVGGTRPRVLGPL